MIIENHVFIAMLMLFSQVDLEKVIEGGQEILDGHVFAFLTFVIVSFIYRKVHVLSRRFRYGELNQYATVYALEQTLGTKFKEAHDAKLEESMKKENFIADKK